MRIATLAFVVTATVAVPAFAQGTINGDGQRSTTSGGEAGSGSQAGSGSEAGGKSAAVNRTGPNVEGAGNGGGRAGSLDQNPGQGGTGAAAPMGAGTDKPK